MPYNIFSILILNSFLMTKIAIDPLNSFNTKTALPSVI